MPRRRDHELIELIDPATGDDLHTPSLASPAPSAPPPSRLRPIAAALVASAAVAGAGVWLQSTESPAPSPAAAATTPAPAPPRTAGQPPRFVGDAPAGMYLVGSRTTGRSDENRWYGVWASDALTLDPGTGRPTPQRWVAVQIWPGTLDDVSVSDGWRHATDTGEVITAFDTGAARWVAWSDDDPNDGAVVQTIAHGFTETELLSLIASFGVVDGEVAIDATGAATGLRRQQTGDSIGRDLLGAGGIVDTLVNPDDGSFLSVHVTLGDTGSQQRFDELARLLLTPTGTVTTATGVTATLYDTGDWARQTLTRVVDGEWAITVTGSVPPSAIAGFVAGLRELTTASDGYGKVSSRYPPDPLSSEFRTAGRDVDAQWRVARRGDQLSWELRVGAFMSVYQQPVLDRGETGETVTVHSLSGNGFTAVWASAPDDGRVLELRVVEAGGATTAVPLRSFASFAGRVLAVHVFAEAHRFTAAVVGVSGEPVAQWPTRGSADQ